MCSGPQATLGMLPQKTCTAQNRSGTNNLVDAKKSETMQHSRHHTKTKENNKKLIPDQNSDTHAVQYRMSTHRQSDLQGGSLKSKK